jgi:hypothetical protein
VVRTGAAIQIEMSFSAVEAREALATGVEVTDDILSVELADGRTIAVPLAWYPRLAHGTTEERASWRLIGGGRGIHWPGLDEDISVANLLAGQPSAESQSSLKKWLAARPKPRRGAKRSKAEPRAPADRRRTTSSSRPATRVRFVQFQPRARVSRQLSRPCAPRHGVV